MRLGWGDVTRRVVACLAAVALGAACALCLPGCLESPVLVNRVLDPDSDNIDYDNPLKNYIPDANATLTSKDIAETTDMTVEEVEKVLYDEPVYDTDEDRATTDEPAKSGRYTDAESSHTTAAKPKASSKGRKSQSESSDSHQKKGRGDESGENDGAGSGSEQGDGDEGGSGDGEGGGTGDEGTGGSGGDEQGGEGTDSGDGDAKATEPGTTFNGNGKVENLPTDLESVCATGETAVIVLSIAGAAQLAGSDEDFLKDSSHQKVFGAKKLAGMTQCWEGDGTESGSADIAAIKKLKPSAVLMESGSASLSAAEQKELREAGISIIVMPQLISDGYIKKAVKAVGHLLSDTTEGKSEDNAKAYVSMVGAVLDAAKATHGGTVSTYNNIDYDNVTDTNPVNSAAGGPTKWTVLITDWDGDARAKASYNGKTIFTETGVALANIGWRWSPVSYYLGCGGAVNNAAAYSAYSSYSGVRMFLNYNENQVSYAWSGLSSKVTVGKDGGSFSQGGTYLLTNACDAREDVSAHYLGSPDFNKVIVRTQAMRDELVKARKETLGLYSPGAYQTATRISGYGHVLNGELLRCYSVVTDSARNDKLYDIVVNPCGLVSTWCDGSMESFLEAAWAASEFSGYGTSKLREDVRGFYDKFYGYELSSDELKAILAGDYA